MKTTEELTKILEDLSVDMLSNGEVLSFDPYIARIRELYDDVDTLPIETRKQRFIESLRPYLEEYGRDTLNSFGKYWLEKRPKGRKFRFEKEDSFDINRRLKTWVKNQRNWSIVGQLKKKS